jgi:hypothetical protein
VGKGSLALIPCPGPLFVLDGARFECPVAPFILDGKDCCWPTGAALWKAVDGLLEEGAVMAEQLHMCGEGDRSEDRRSFIGESPLGWMSSEAANMVSLEVINFHRVLSYKMVAWIWKNHISLSNQDRIQNVNILVRSIKKISAGGHH